MTGVQTCALPILVNGNHIDYKKARFEYLKNGDPVIFVDEIPLYVQIGRASCRERV